MNKLLKQRVAKAGIDKEITYHASQYAFGTMMMTVGADLYATLQTDGTHRYPHNAGIRKDCRQQENRGSRYDNKLFEQKEAGGRKD